MYVGTDFPKMYFSFIQIFTKIAHCDFLKSAYMCNEIVILYHRNVGASPVAPRFLSYSSEHYLHIFIIAKQLKPL